MFCYQRSTPHPLFPPFDYHCPTKGTLHDLPSLASPKGEITSSFSWTFLFKSPTSSTLCFGDPRLSKLNQVKLLHETEFYITKYIPLCDFVVHTGTTVLLTFKTLPHKPKMYLQDKHSTTPSEVQSEETEEATPSHLTKVYKSLSHGTEDINCPGSKLLALLDHTFAEYLFLCLIDAHGKTPLCGSHQVPLDYGQTKHVGTLSSLLLQTLLSLFQALLPTHTKFLTATPT